MCGSGDNAFDRCTGASYQKCNVLGVGWVEESSCGSGACTLPGGACIDPIVEVQGDLEKGDFVLLDDELYWLSEGTVLRSPVEPGSSATVVVELPENNPDFISLAGSLLGVIADGLAKMSRIKDGTELVSVAAGEADMFPMPTTDGLFWRDGSSDELKFAAPGDASASALGALPPGDLSPSFCGDSTALYFIAQFDQSSGTLHRFTDAGIESVAPGASFVVCREDDVLVATTAGIISVKPDGSQDVLLTESFDTLFTIGNDFIAGGDRSGKSKSLLNVGNLVTGEIRSIYDFGGPQTSSFAADETNVYFIASIQTGGGTAGPPQYGPPQLMRGTWR